MRLRLHLHPKRWLCGFASLSLILLLTACGQGSQFKDLRQYVEELRNRALHKKASVKILTPPAAITYTADQLRQPFVQTQSASQQVKNTSNPLQAYPLNVLRFVGTMGNAASMKAYVATPDGLIFEVQVGDVLGDHKGKIISINQDQVNVREEFLQNGQVSAWHDTTLQLDEGKGL
jgi:type IV pilus assembly protein PilP